MTRIINDETVSGLVFLTFCELQLRKGHAILFFHEITHSFYSKFV